MVLKKLRSAALRTWAGPGVAVSLLLLGAGCASSGKPPVAEITAARASITQAESVGAVQQAPVDLLAAREKLGRAEAAVRDKRYLQARQLADEAQVDAEVAERRTRAMKAQQAVAELERSNQLLREEIERKARP